MSRSALRRYRAERLLRKDFPEQRAKVLAVVRSRLRSKNISLDHADLESCYAQAFHGLYATVLGGEEIENPTGWLVTVTFRRAIDESRSAARRRGGSEGQPAWGDSADEGQWAASDPDVARTLDDRATLRHVFEGLRASLNPRECEAASLCYLQGLSRAEAAKRMGIREARMHKLMDGAGPGRPGVAGRMEELLHTIKAGEWCEQQSSLMRAYAFGILDPEGERHALAMVHCRECPACRAHVASLRGLAAVLPPLPLTLALAGASGGAGAKAGVAVKPSSALPTSLTAKLAVTAVIVVGAGYGVLGSHAHGSTPAHRSGARSIDVSTSSAYGPKAPSATRPRARRSRRRPLAAHAHSAGKTRSTGRASNNEFGPERVGGSSKPATSSTASGSSGTSGTATGPGGGTEFGFE